MSGIHESPPVIASAIVMAEARANCAAYLRARGTEAEEREAVMFETGKRDQSFKMRHEVKRLFGTVPADV